jgi:hypothetical protein
LCCYSNDFGIALSFTSEGVRLNHYRPQWRDVN